MLLQGSTWQIVHQESQQEDVFGRPIVKACTWLSQIGTYGGSQWICAKHSCIAKVYLFTVQNADISFKSIERIYYVDDVY